MLLCVLLCMAPFAVTAAETTENPLDGYFYSVSYAYYDGGLQKQYNPSREDLSEPLTEEIRSLLKEATQNPMEEKPEDLGHRRIKVIFCDTDKPNEENNDHVRYSYDLCDNGIRITKENAVWHGSYDTFDLVPDETVPTRYVSYNNTDYSKKIGLLLNEHIGGDTEYPDFEFITDLTFHYEGDIFLQENLPKSMGYTWGICNYYMNGELCTGAFLRSDAIYLAPVTETNTVHWDGVTRFFPKTSSDAGLNGYFYENPDRKDALSADAVFTLDENYVVKSVKFSVKDSNYPDGITADVSADIYDANGILKKNINRYSYHKGTLAGIDGFAPSPEAEEKPVQNPTDTEKNEEPEEEKTEPDPDYTPDTEMKEATEAFYNIISTAPVDSVSGYYLQDGKTRTYSLLRADLEATGKADIVRNLFLSHDIRMQEFINPDSTKAFQIDFSLPASSGKSQTAKITLYDDHAYVLMRYPSVADGETIMKAKKFSFLYRGTNLKTAFEELFREEQEAHASVPYVFQPEYVDISEERRESAADFTISLSSAQMQSWLGEFAENGVVKMQVSYFRSQSDYPESMMTISGNGKTLNLMKSGVLRNQSNKQYYAVYATSTLGINGIDTSLKTEPLQHGSLSLNCLSGSQYNVRKNAGELKVSVYDVYNTSLPQKEKDMDKYRVGDAILVTNAGELTENPDIPETPITETAEILQFQDVPQTHWAYTPVHNFYRATFVNGVGNDMFAPDQYMTYEHFGFLLTRIFGYTMENNQSTPAPRQDVIAQLVYAMGLENYQIQNENILSEKFSDADDILPANLSAVAIAAEKGLVQGANGKLYPNDSLTRAECVTLLSRAITEAFGITEEDAPETYKLKIYRSQDGYKTVTAEDLAEFKIGSNNVYDVYIKDFSRVKGTALFTFGKDTLKDSHAVAVCYVGADVYLFEMSALDGALFRQGDNLSAALHGTLHIYKNGKLYRTLTNTWMKYEDFAEYVTIKHGSCMISFHKTYETEGKYPASYAVEEEPETYYSNYMVGEIGLGLGKGRDLEIGYDSDILGNLVLRHNNLRTDAEVNATFTATDIYGMTNTYQITLENRTSMTVSELSGTFVIHKNGAVWETVTGKLTHLDAGIGNRMYFVSDDGVWNIEFTITEIGKNN